MIALLATVALASAPRALPGAESGIHIPRLDRMQGVVAVMSRAGERSVMVRPSTWFSDAHPVFYVDFSRPDTLADVAIDPGAPATLSTRKEGRMTCHGISDAKRFDERVRGRLASLGTLWEGKVGGLPALGVLDGEGPALLSAVVWRGKVACAVSAKLDARPLLHFAAQATGKAPAQGAWARLAGLKGEVFVVMGDVTVGLTGSGDELVADGRARGLPAPGLASGSQSPYAALAPEGLGVLKASVRARDVPGAVKSLTRTLAQQCQACPREQVAALERILAAQMTGQVALVVHTAQMKGKLRTDADKFFAARHVWLAEVRDPAAVRQALAALEKVDGVRAEGEGWVLPMDAGREVRAGLRGRHLYLANDRAALEATLGALPEKPGKLLHGLEVGVDPARLHRTLAQVSLMDVLGSRDLAGVLAASTELGPVLEITRSLTGWADSDPAGGHRFGAVLTLKPAE